MPPFRKLFLQSRFGRELNEEVCERDLPPDANKNYIQTVDNLDRTPASVPPRLRDEAERGKPPPKQRLEALSSSADEKNDGL